MPAEVGGWTAWPDRRAVSATSNGDRKGGDWVRVSADYSTQVLTSGARQVTTELGKHDFLQLLVAQMRHQDPLKPMEDREFIAQLAQFSALEQMMNVSLAANLNYGMGVLGKWVYATDAGGNPVEGRAISVRLADGSPVVRLETAGGAFVEVALDKVMQVDSEQQAAGE